MKWLFSRLREPSTWCGLAMVASAAMTGGALTPVAIAQAVGGAAAVLMKEGAPSA
jgi:hypothetical protein